MQTNIIITNVLPTRTAFGVVADGSEAVFIPSRVADAADVRIGQTVKALLVPNQTQPEKTPWMAVFIGEKNDEDTLAEDIKTDLERGPATAFEVAFSIDRPVELVARKMREMNQAGLLKSEPLYDLIASNAEGNA